MFFFAVDLRTSPCTYSRMRHVGCQSNGTLGPLAFTADAGRCRMRWSPHASNQAFTTSASRRDDDSGLSCQMSWRGTLRQTGTAKPEISSPAGTMRLPTMHSPGAITASLQISAVPKRGKIRRVDFAHNSIARSCSAQAERADFECGAFVCNQVRDNMGEKPGQTESAPGKNDIVSQVGENRIDMRTEVKFSLFARKSAMASKCSSNVSTLRLRSSENISGPRGLVRSRTTP
jgi:hypothetical protein